MRLVRYTYPTTRAFANVARSPWAGLETEIDRLFESALHDVNGSAPDRFPVDVYQDAENRYVRAELPGVARDDINIELADGYLTITAARKAGDETFSATRSIGIADDTDPSKVAAQYENGMLTVTLPKREEAKPKKITVAVK